MADEKQTHGNDAQETRKFTRDDVAKMISAERDKWEIVQKEAEKQGRAEIRTKTPVAWPSRRLSSF